MMDTFEEYLNTIEDEEHRARLRKILSWVLETFPNLAARIAWNQPMVTDHGTFILGFSVSKGHISVSPEQALMEKFSHDIDRAGYKRSKQLFRITWKDEINYKLLEKIIAFNIEDKANVTSFWRKS